MKRPRHTGFARGYAGAFGYTRNRPPSLKERQEKSYESLKRGWEKVGKALADACRTYGEEIGHAT